MPAGLPVTEDGRVGGMEVFVMIALDHQLVEAKRWNGSDVGAGLKPAPTPRVTPADMKAVGGG